MNAYFCGHNAGQKTNGNSTACKVQNYPAAQTLSPPCCLASNLVAVMYELQQGHKREADHGRQEEDCPEAL